MRSDFLFRRLVCLVAVVAAAMPFAPAPSSAAEFAEGMKAYESSDFAAARAVFLDLAELGDGPSQYNLGVMALKGEGVPEDRAEAAGWLLVARENGHDPTPRALDGLLSKLEPREREAAERIVFRFGRAALAGTVLPAPDRGSLEMRAPKLLESTPATDLLDTRELRAGLAVVEGVIGSDGRLRDAEVVFAAEAPQPGPAGTFSWRTNPSRRDSARALADGALRAVLHHRYEPARLHGETVPVNFRFTLRVTQVMSHDVFDPLYRESRIALGVPRAGRPAVSFDFGDRQPLVDDRLGQRLLAAARRGEPRAQLAVEVLRLTDREGVSPPGDHVLAAAQAGLPEAQLMLGTALARAGQSARALPWLERASRAGLPSARVRYGLALLESGGAPPEKVHDLLSRASEDDDPYSARHAMEALACSRTPGLRDPQAALAAAQRARLDDDDPLNLAALAAAQASAGDRAGAARSQRDAIARAKRLGWSVDEMEQRLAGYEAGRPCESPFLPRAGFPWHDPPWR